MAALRDYAKRQLPIGVRYKMKRYVRNCSMRGGHCMRLLPVLECLVICATVTASAQDTSSYMKLDSMSTNQNVLARVHPAEPLANKTFGIEFNPVRLLLGWTTNEIGNYTHLSGGVSFFAVDRHAEIAIPFLYQFGTLDNLPYKILNIDVAYRRFINGQQNGFHLSAGLRYAYVEGEEGQESVTTVARSAKHIIRSKAGIYIGIGYRYFSRSGWYGGTNILYGRFFSNDDRAIVDVKMDDLPFILDFELLKIGYTF